MHNSLEGWGLLSTIGRFPQIALTREARKLLRSPTIRRVALAVQSTPSITISEARWKLRTSWDTISRAVNRLEVAGVLWSIRDGNGRHLYLKDGLTILEEDPEIEPVVTGERPAFQVGAVVAAAAPYAGVTRHAVRLTEPATARGAFWKGDALCGTRHASRGGAWRIISSSRLHVNCPACREV